MNNIRVRFAPSPTGHLHVGSVRVAIFNWLYAKHNNGKYLMRVEDTDLLRSTKEFLNSQIDSLRWLNLLPDEPIVYQMSRIEEHKKVVKYMLEKQLAYPCFCSQENLDKKREEYAAAGKTYKYEGTCRNLNFTEKDLEKPHAIRFKVPEDCDFVEFDDMIRGNVRVESEHLDDFVIMRSDGTPTYNFVVVLDDIYMKISHIIRGEDHISNTPKQILIYRSLGAKIPCFAHLPLILGPGGNRLSKRDAAVSVQEYKEKGFLPDALFNYLVRLGWSHGDQEIFTKEDMVKYFDFSNVGKKGAIFDIKKLEWLNGVYLREKGFEQLLASTKDLGSDYYEKLKSLWSDDNLELLFNQYKQRSARLLDIVQDIISLAHDPMVLDISLISKWINKKTPELLRTFLDEFVKASIFSHDVLLNMANDVCKKLEVKLVDLAQPLRLALTGKIFSPGVFELMGILGKDVVVKRVNFLINKLNGEL